MRADYLLSGRILYAIAMIAFGVICLGYLDLLNSLHNASFPIPGRPLLAVLTGLLLALAGLAILANVRPCPAGLALTTLWLLGLVVLHIPSAFIDPSLLPSPLLIRIFESLVLAGAALIIAGLAANPVRESWVRAGRIAFGISLPVFGILHFIYPEFVVLLVASTPVSFPSPLFWAYFTGAGHFAAGAAIAAGVFSRVAAILAGFMYASWVFALHLPRVISHPPPRSGDIPAGYAGDRSELTSTAICVAFWGAAWLIAGSLAKQKGRTFPEP